MLRVDSENPALVVVDLDVNGNPFYHYMGQPFTGIMEIYENGVLAAEFESEAGYEWGLQKEYYSSGLPASEYYIGPGGLHGRYRTWDANGSIVYDKMWINGIEQK